MVCGMKRKKLTTKHWPIVGEEEAIRQIESTVIDDAVLRRLLVILLRVRALTPEDLDWVLSEIGTPKLFAVVSPDNPDTDQK